MKKSVIRTLAVSAMSVGSLVSMTACSGVQGAVYTPGTPVKVGLICLHDEKSTYDANFINALREAAKELGDTKVVLEDANIKTGIDENEACYNAAKELVKKGCNLIFADSFGHQSFMLDAAKEWPSVQFCHATGTNAKDANLDNYHNAFASIYEGRFLAGVAAGARLVADNYAACCTDPADPATYDPSKFPDLKVGYVGAYSYAEVKSGYTAWFLGVRMAAAELGNVNPSKITMDVRCTGSWYDITKEGDAATALIADGAVLLSQHADSMGAPNVCEGNKPNAIPNVTYNIETYDVENKTGDCPKSYLAYSRINWAPYYKAVVNAMFDGKAIEGETNHNWTGTLAGGSVEENVNWDNVVVNLPEAMRDTAKTEWKKGYNDLKENLVKGEFKVFDVKNFTVTVDKSDEDPKKWVNGNAEVDADGHLTKYMADTNGDYIGDTDVISAYGTSGKFFDESKYCSAPYFDLDIDGIKVVTAAY